MYIFQCIFIIQYTKYVSTILFQNGIYRYGLDNIVPRRAKVSSCKHSDRVQCFLCLHADVLVCRLHKQSPGCLWVSLGQVTSSKMLLSRLNYGAFTWQVERCYTKGQCKTSTELKTTWLLSIGVWRLSSLVPLRQMCSCCWVRSQAT